MIHVKICGITNNDDARAAVELGADAVGFVFARSTRAITPEQARLIIRHTPPFITTVGVFMDQDIDEIERMCQISGIDVAQLHGDESPSCCRTLNRRVIKRLRVDGSTTNDSLCRAMALYDVGTFLLDPGAGSGKAFDWSIARNIEQRIIVAGGLDPENISQVIDILHPYGVDVSSGVEKFPGTKDHKKIARFIKEVRRCS